MNINFYVITLKNKNEYKKSDNYKSLKQITNKIYIVRGVIFNKKHKDVDKYKYYPNGAIGITLAHKKAWNMIKKKDTNEYSIILEDDTILNINSVKFNSIISNICKTNTFDVYKLHYDGWEFISLAAYIINNSSISKLLTESFMIFGHIDIDLYISSFFSDIKLINHKKNLFMTDESISSHRNEKYTGLKLFNYKISNRSNKKIKDILSYKIFRINNYEFITYELMLFVLLCIAYYFNNKYLFFMIIILLVI